MRVFNELLEFCFLFVPFTAKFAVTGRAGVTIHAGVGPAVLLISSWGYVINKAILYGGRREIIKAILTIQAIA